MDTPQKTNANELDLHDDQSYWRDEQPFCGIACYYRDDGSLESEVEFRDGMQEGVVRDWNEEGKLVFEASLHRTVLHGVSRTRNDQGALIKEETHEYGICTGRNEWDDNGHLIAQWTIGPDDADYSVLESSRQAYAFENDAE